MQQKIKECHIIFMMINKKSCGTSKAVSMKILLQKFLSHSMSSLSKAVTELACFRQVPSVPTLPESHGCYSPTFQCWM